MKVYHSFQGGSKLDVASESLLGLKLVAFFVAAQHLCIAFYEDDPDFSIYMGQLRSITKVVYAEFGHKFCGLTTL